MRPPSRSYGVHQPGVPKHCGVLRGAASGDPQPLGKHRLLVAISPGRIAPPLVNEWSVAAWPGPRRSRRPGLALAGVERQVRTGSAESGPVRTFLRALTSARRNCSRPGWRQAPSASRLRATSRRRSLPHLLLGVLLVLACVGAQQVAGPSQVRGPRFTGHTAAVEVLLAPSGWRWLGTTARWPPTPRSRSGASGCPVLGVVVRSCSQGVRSRRRSPGRCPPRSCPSAPFVSRPVPRSRSSRPPQGVGGEGGQGADTAAIRCTGPAADRSGIRASRAVRPSRRRLREPDARVPAPLDRGLPLLPTGRCSRALPAPAEVIDKLGLW
jgi:hypothetical protein